MTLYLERECICREVENPSNLAISLANQANLLARKMGKQKEALHLAEEAYDPANKNGLSALAQKVKQILDVIKNIYGLITLMVDRENGRVVDAR